MSKWEFFLIAAGGILIVIAYLSGYQIGRADTFLKSKEKHSFELYQMYHKGFDIGFDRAKLNCD